MNERDDLRLQLVRKAIGPSKMKRLRAAGWKAGTAAEFLGMSEAEAALVELKLMRVPLAAGASGV